MVSSNNELAYNTKIEGDGFRVLSDGAVVRYDAERGEKGWNATRVIRVATADEPVTATRRTYSRTPRR